MGITEGQIARAVALAKAYGATRLILFGSALEDPERAKDLDLALEGVAGWKLRPVQLAPGCAGLKSPR